MGHLKGPTRHGKHTLVLASFQDLYQGLSTIDKERGTGLVGEVGFGTADVSSDHANILGQNATYGMAPYQEAGPRSSQLAVHRGQDAVVYGPGPPLSSIQVHSGLTSSESGCPHLEAMLHQIWSLGVSGWLRSEPLYYDYDRDAIRSYSKGTVLCMWTPWEHGMSS